MSITISKLRIKPRLGARADLGHPLSEGCVGWYLFNEGGGARLWDISTSKNHGTLTTMTPASDWVAGVRGPALDFDQTNDSVVLTKDTIGTGIVTVTAWVNPAAVNVLQTVISNASFVLGMPSTLGRLSLTSNHSTTIYSADNAMVAKAWTHVCAVRLADGSATLYINGRVSGTPGSSGTPGAGSVPKIGADSNSAYWGGLIDNLRIFNRALPVSEIEWMVRDPYVNIARPRYRRYSVSGGATVLAVPGTATADGIVPALSADSNITGVAGTASAAGIAPVVSASFSAAGVAGTATAEAIAPAVSAESTVIGVAGTASASGIAATLSAGSDVAGVAGTATAAGVAPSLQASSEIAATTATAAAVGIAPTISAGSEVQAITGTATADAPAPVVSGGGGGDATVVGVAGVASAAAIAPFISAGSEIAAVLGAASAIGIAPVISAGSTVLAVAAAAVAAGIAPEFSAGSTVTAVAGTASATAIAPTISSSSTLLAADRSFAVAPELRILLVELEIRTFSVAQQNRTLDA